MAERRRQGQPLDRRHLVDHLAVHLADAVRAGDDEEAGDALLGQAAQDGVGHEDGLRARGAGRLRRRRGHGAPEALRGPAGPAVHHEHRHLARRAGPLVGDDDGGLYIYIYI